MTRESILKRWPRSTEETIASLMRCAGGEVPNTKQRERPKALESDSVREAQSTGCVSVSFTLHRVRLLDVDAKYASVKDLLDCLVAAGFVAGDKEGQVDLQVRQEKVKTKAEERTEIEITTP